MKAFCAGAVMAAAAGLLMGGAMKPDFGWEDRPAGPQMVAGTDAGRPSGPFDDGALTYAGFAGKVPDWVYGTDWKTASVQPMEASAPREAADPKPARPDDEPAPVELTRADYDEGPPPRISYPSIDGGQPSDPDALPPQSEPDQG